MVLLGTWPRRFFRTRPRVFKVTTATDEGGRMVLKLEGRLADSWVDELTRVACVAMSEDAQVTFDLDGLSFIDVNGVALLHGAAKRGARLTGGSTFVTALMDRERYP